MTTEQLNEMYKLYKKKLTTDLYETIDNFKTDIDKYDQYLFVEFRKDILKIEKIIDEIDLKIQETERPFNYDDIPF